MTPPARPHLAIRVGLGVIAGFSLVSALVGMFGLTLANGMGLPAEWLDATIFPSYVVPGILLGVLIGGSQSMALLAQRRDLEVAWGLHAAAGLIILVWIFVELATLLVWHPLHGVFFVAGLVQATLAILALGAWPRPFLVPAAHTSVRRGGGTSTPGEREGSDAGRG